LPFGKSFDLQLQSSSQSLKQPAAWFNQLGKAVALHDYDYIISVSFLTYPFVAGCYGGHMVEKPHDPQDLPKTQEVPGRDITQAEATWPLIHREIPPELLPLLPGHVAVGHIVSKGDDSLRPFQPDR
jgi:hypothetical protein